MCNNFKTKDKSLSVQHLFKFLLLFSTVDFYFSESFYRYSIRFSPMQCLFNLLGRVKAMSVTLHFCVESGRDFENVHKLGLFCLELIPSLLENSEAGRTGTSPSAGFDLAGALYFTSSAVINRGGPVIKTPLLSHLTPGERTNGPK